LGGWQYGLPLNYPVPSVVFGCGGFYIGGYCSATADQLMAKAEVSQSVKALYPLEDYLAKDLPVIWLPLQPYNLSAISSRLKGVDPQNTQGLITPEFWSVK
jgi:peptide/nickel transport system substrate-binding protein